ncbi:unnamed protein product [Rotaria sordida]|uniref:ABC transporter domain-containing protein n=2 Tax=Rotaria sordida TaxID=392033 RepID=A0A819I5J0_9BILA|nr:unnamed protein product [Rotaria sordida]CAF3911187.1 unnamed protein product [Rotaria sordida]CAF3933394.1 unnamed protein product [Rotaria sordida]
MILSLLASAWLTGKQILIGDIFTALTCYTQIRTPITCHLPRFIEKLSGLRIAMKRIDDFMNLKTIQSRTLLTPFSDKPQSKDLIVLRNASLSWNDSNTCLSSLNINIEPGTFVGIVGPVAAGKSSLLKAILGELNLIDGELEVNTSSLSYAAQIPWLVADTLRANIILGKTFDKQRYSSVIHACCLDIDIVAFGPNGDLIMIGDRGINLSGGQKARVSLARTLYTDADIYLLDDPLAAVDRKVARLIYDQCIGPNGLLSKKTRLLITHQIEFLTESHQTILLENGRIVAQGRVTDLPLEYRDIYQNDDDQLIMDDVSTSSGKSSVFRGLLRLIAQSNIKGAIIIDGIDISRVKLQELRSHISIIPQHSVLFTGTLRYNLDPYNQYTDEQCWKALDNVQLKKIIADHPSGLLLPVAESGNNFSAGQCQLICIARAILKESKIVLIDEATANVDHETEKLIQKNKKDYHDNNTKEIKDENNDDNIVVDVPYVGNSTNKFINDIKQPARHIKPGTSIIAIQRPPPKGDISSDTNRDVDISLVKNQNDSNNKSAIYRHMIETNHQIDWQNWRLLDKDKHPYELLVRESLAILEYAPTLNLTTRSVPLIVFPDGHTSRRKERNKT